MLLQAKPEDEVHYQHVGHHGDKETTHWRDLTQTFNYCLLTAAVPSEAQRGE